MVSLLIPLVLVLCFSLFGALAAQSFIAAEVAKDSERGRAMKIALEMAGIKQKPERLALLAVAVGGVAWFLLTAIMGAGILTTLMLMPVCLGVPCAGMVFFVKFKVGAVRNKFLDQLEISLRLISSGIRIGLSLPQAMGVVTEEMEEPSRSEFMRVIGQTRLGVSTADALEDLAQRMPGSETIMLSRVVRIQSQTGGNLSTILDHLAETIKDRRRIARKISALTAEGRMGALVLESLPIGVGVFICIMERPMGQALLGTWIGHLVLGWVGFLEAMAIFSLNKMLQVNV